MAAEIQKIQADAQLSLAKAQNESPQGAMQDMQMNAQKHQMDMGSKMQDMQMKEQTHQMDMRHAGIKAQNEALKPVIDMQKHKMNMENKPKGGLT